MFFGCDKLKTVKLPSGMSQLNPSAFDKCRKLSKMTISSKSKSFSVMDKCIVNNKDKSLVFCYASDKKYNIPKGVKVLKKNSFVGCRSKSIHIPASVKKIEGATFEDSYGKTLGKIHDVTVAKNNKIYARDGYTIYNKKDKTLSIAIAAYNKKNEEYTYVMSNKVKRLTKEQNLVNIYASLYGKALDKVYMSKKLKTNLSLLIFMQEKKMLCWSRLVLLIAESLKM